MDLFFNLLLDALVVGVLSLCFGRPLFVWR
jgi:hypothetical protein